MNEQEGFPEGRKAILCDKDRCRWRTGLSRHAPINMLGGVSDRTTGKLAGM